MTNIRCHTVIIKEMRPHQLVHIFHDLCHYHSIFGISWSEEEEQNNEKAYTSVSRVEVDEFK